MNNNKIQRYTSILLGKENVETISDLQLLFNRYCVNISRRFDAVKNGEPMLYRREDITQWAKEAFERGEKYFYCKPVDEKNPYILIFHSVEKIYNKYFFFITIFICICNCGTIIRKCSFNR